MRTRNPATNRGGSSWARMVGALVILAVLIMSIHSFGFGRRSPSSPSKQDHSSHTPSKPVKENVIPDSNEEPGTDESPLDDSDDSSGDDDVPANVPDSEDGEEPDTEVDKPAKEEETGDKDSDNETPTDDEDEEDNAEDEQPKPQEKPKEKPKPVEQPKTKPDADKPKTKPAPRKETPVDDGQIKHGKSVAFQWPKGVKLDDFYPVPPVPDSSKYAGWPRDGLGNHRFVVEVPANAGSSRAVKVLVEWRRRDDPYHDLLGYAMSDNSQVHNVDTPVCDKTKAWLIFQPTRGQGHYAFYYMPWSRNSDPYNAVASYHGRQQRSDHGWLSENVHGDKWRNLPEARVLFFDGRRDTDRFTAMEFSASDEETALMTSKLSSKETYVTFTVPRELPIRMKYNVPISLVERKIAHAEKRPDGLADWFAGKCGKGEYYLWQIAVWAPNADLGDFSVTWTDLVHKDSPKNIIPAKDQTCINTEGYDHEGKYTRYSWNVAKGHVGSLWMGIDVPLSAKPGIYQGMVTVKPNNAEAQLVAVTLTVTEEEVPDHGDSDIHKLSRIRWLNSRIGLDDHVPKHFKDMELDEETKTIRILHRTFKLTQCGFVQSAVADFYGQPFPILEEPFEMVAFPKGSQDEIRDWSGRLTQFDEVKKSYISWTSSCTSLSQMIRMIVKATMDMDGYIAYNVSFISINKGLKVELEDVHLRTKYTAAAAKYFMGMGFRGGFAPASHDWKWPAGHRTHVLYVGEPEGGMWFKIKGNFPRWDEVLFFIPEGGPASWGNGGRGAAQYRDRKIKVFTGAKTITDTADENTQFIFDCIFTPVKKLDTKRHFNEERYHQILPESEHEPYNPDRVKNNWNPKHVIIHANSVHLPHINWPLDPRTVAELRKMSDRTHELGMNFKIYFTTRELSVFMPETFVFRQLPEFYHDGPGGGAAWSQEHLQDHYLQGWTQDLNRGIPDYAIQQKGVSRFNNYYLEGVKYLADPNNPHGIKLDGLYWDALAFMRPTMKRLRSFMDKVHPSFLTDYHCGNSYSGNDDISPMLQMIHFMPYFDSLMFGEGYDYHNTMHDYLMTEVSGITMGIMNDMLGAHHIGRGMVFGMITRVPWYYNNIDHWRLWDQFGLGDAEMVGYWARDPVVTPSDPQIKATAYIRKGLRTMVALGSWSGATSVSLTIKWDQLGLEPSNTRVVSPIVSNLHNTARVFKATESIPIEANQGAILIYEAANSQIKWRGQ